MKNMHILGNKFYIFIFYILILASCGVDPNIETTPLATQSRSSTHENNMDKSSINLDGIKEKIYNGYQNVLISGNTGDLLRLFNELKLDPAIEDQLDDFIGGLSSITNPETKNAGVTKLVLTSKYHDYTQISSGYGWIEGGGDISILGGTNMTPSFNHFTTRILANTINFDSAVLFAGEGIIREQPQFQIVNPTKGGNIPLLSIQNEGNKVFTISIAWLPNDIDYNKTTALQLVVIYADNKKQVIHFPVEIYKYNLVVKEKLIPGQLHYSTGGYDMDLYLMGGSVPEDICPKLAAETAKECITTILEKYPNPTVRIWTSAQKGQKNDNNGGEKMQLNIPYILINLSKQ